MGKSSDYLLAGLFALALHNLAVGDAGRAEADRRATWRSRDGAPLMLAVFGVG